MILARKLLNAGFLAHAYVESFSRATIIWLTNDDGYVPLEVITPVSEVLFSTVEKLTT